jgi:hypothetical protein
MKISVSASIHDPSKLRQDGKRAHRTTSKQPNHASIPLRTSTTSKYSLRRTALERNNSLVIVLTKALCTRWCSACQYAKFLSHQNLGRQHSNRTLTHCSNAHRMPGVQILLCPKARTRTRETSSTIAAACIPATFNKVHCTLYK